MARVGGGKELFHLVCADGEGRLYQEPELAVIGRSGEEYWPLGAEELIPLPPGAEVAILPGRSPLGMDRRGRATVISSDGRGPLWAVGALLPPGYLRLALPAWEKEKEAPPLGLFGYTALASRKGRLYAAALALDPEPRWDPRHYNLPELAHLVAERRQNSPENRLLAHLAHCAEVYRCYTAQNLFYRRWEAGIPVSPACNAGCLGCISLQEAECCPAPQKRLEFVPTPEEVRELMEPHLAEAPEAIVSFGQGCEGEPLLQAELLEEVIGLVRRRTARGSINLNSNGGDPRAVERLCQAGLDCLRISLFSARPALYDLYHRPRGYGLAEVRRSIALAVQAGVYTSLNLLVLPGFTDRPEEVEALADLIAETGLQRVQLRNLNIDPDWLFPLLPPAEGRPLGVIGLVKALHRRFPRLELGSYTLPHRHCHPHRPVLY